jgi:D-3-phosphoglycerate dehydrogenase
VTTDNQEHEALGTIFGQSMPRLVALDGYRLEAYLDGRLLIFHHQDIPGVIGNVGTIFGEHGINIAQMAVGRAGDAPGGKAVGVLNLDSEPSSKCLEQVLQHPSVSQASVIQLPKAGELPSWLQ